jgi:hypothetical protein
MSIRMKNRCGRSVWLVVLLVLGWTTTSLALDPGIYAGVWQTQNAAMHITLRIGPDPAQAEITVNGQTLAHAQVEYLYGRSAVYPFLFVRVAEENPDPQAAYMLVEHALYLIIGGLGEGGRPTGRLRGFYDYARVRNDHHGTVESVSYPVEFAPAR